MDPRQMVALRKMMGGDEGAESGEEMAVQCPECGCSFVPEPPSEEGAEQGMPPEMSGQ